MGQMLESQFQTFRLQSRLFTTAKDPGLGSKPSDINSNICPIVIGYSCFERIVKYFPVYTQFCTLDKKHTEVFTSIHIVYFEFLNN